MVNQKAKEDCCGCRSCEHICPTKAIKMVEDEKGFRYPTIDEELCNKCGLCDKVCGFNNNYKNYGDNPIVLAVKNKDENVRITSSSGGMFVALSDEILRQNGVIYGTAYGEKLYVCHKRAETEKQRDEFKGSKYVQSDLGDTFFSVRRDLHDNKKVLFIGTPCQVAALNSFLLKDYKNLITIDLLCHGTPSNKIWQDYLNVIEQVNKGKVVKVFFRDKTFGWHQYRTKIIFDKPYLKKIKGEQSYYQLFIPCYMMMPACHNCKFRNYKRPGDITIADFWGIERTMPEFDDNKGISLVFINSPLGNELFNQIKDKLIIKESVKENCAQDQIVEPVPKNKKSVQFWREYQKYGMKYVMIKYTDYTDFISVIKRVINKIKIIIGFDLSY